MSATYRREHRRAHRRPSGPANPRMRWASRLPLRAAAAGLGPLPIRIAPLANTDPSSMDPRPARLRRPCAELNSFDVGGESGHHDGVVSLPDRPSEIEYLRRIEDLANAVCDRALDEGVLRYLDDDDQTPLQQAINELARNLQHVHRAGDGCLDAVDAVAELTHCRRSQAHDVAVWRLHRRRPPVGWYGLDGSTGENQGAPAGNHDAV